MHEKIFPKGYGLAVQRNNEKLRDKLSQTILELHHNGKIDDFKNKWWDRNTPQAKKCLSTDQKLTAEFSIGEFSGVYIILISGIIIGVTIAFFEYYTNRSVNAAKNAIALDKGDDSAHQQNTLLLHRRKNNDLFIVVKNAYSCQESKSGINKNMLEPAVKKKEPENNKKMNLCSNCKSETINGKNDRNRKRRDRKESTNTTNGYFNPRFSPKSYQSKMSNSSKKLLITTKTKTKKKSVLFHHPLQTHPDNRSYATSEISNFKTPSRNNSLHLPINFHDNMSDSHGSNRSPNASTKMTNLVNTSKIETKKSSKQTTQKISQQGTSVEFTQVTTSNSDSDNSEHDQTQAVLPIRIQL